MATTRCKGTTNLGKICRNNTVDKGDFCPCHSYQHSCYVQPDSHWPDIHKVRSHSHKFEKSLDIIKYIDKVYKKYFKNANNNYQERLGILIMAETLMLNEIPPDIEPIRGVISSFIESQVGLEKYYEHFRKRTDKEYKRAHRIKLAEEILTKTVLDDSSISMISRFL